MTEGEKSASEAARPEFAVVQSRTIRETTFRARTLQFFGGNELDRARHDLVSFVVVGLVSLVDVHRVLLFIVAGVLVAVPRRG